MTAPSIILPPGPLSWLFPELDTLVAEAPPSTTPIADVLGLLEAGAVQWPQGPRGRAFAQVVRERSASDAVPWRDALGDAGDGLEARLGRAAQLVADLPLVRCGADGSFTPVDSPAGEDLHLLPLRAGDHLEADLVRAATLLPELGVRHACVVPYFATSPHPVERAWTRLPESWWGILPGERYPDEIRVMIHAIWRAAWPERYPRFLAHENWALAGFDLYATALRAECSAAVAPPVPSDQARVIGICGIDGSGKSTHVAALADHLREQGLRVAVHKIYRHGVFHDTVTELTRQCAEGRNLHLWRVQRLVKAFDSVKYYHTHVAPDLATHDVLIFDRYVQTHFAAGMGRYHEDPHTREMLAPYPPADLLFWMNVPLQQTLQRLATRAERTVDENPYMLGRYAHAFADLAVAQGMRELDARAPFDDNQEVIRRAADALLAGGRV